ncbi:phosphate ABC transporter substrate-binding protein PstS [Methylobacterium iners]|uniref:Phosphate-binding protein PstS n=1 Tax=Methylobacterium iners TaxID=418707 RepID=A0ABQ4RX06_9HYPH|nr:phosphate ABC transporter substrate-binding protein PstS [Methylobacterium iners]GJD94158.1 Phosphate-binding protein PstS [Methylobacterium iners]
MRALIVATLLLAVCGPAAAQTIRGAGSTFVQPLLARWSQDWLRAQRDAEFQPIAAGLDYEPVGSQAGVMRLRDRGVDFAATEQPLSRDELDRFGLLQFPIAVGGVVAAVNVPGIDGNRLRLTGAVLAEIYRGRIRTWDDPAIRALNPDLALPSAAIAPVRRLDGSGTTAVFTAYLAAQAPAWRTEIGEGLTVAWPAGAAAKGNDGVADAVRRTRFSLGYMDYGSARRAGLAVVALRNREGRWARPEPASFAAAAQSADWRASPGFAVSLVDAPGETTYPLVAAIFAVVPADGAASAGRRAATAFFDWSFDNGALRAAELGFVPLPAPLVKQVRGAWSPELRTGAR